jgi:exodeoxyribonuclease V beta subunit
VRALSTDLLGKSSEELYQLLNNDIEFDQAKNDFFEYKKLWEKKGIFVFIVELLKSRYKKQHNSVSNERALTNYMHLAKQLITHINC